MARNQRNAAAISRSNPIYPTYTPPSRPAASSIDTYDSYEAEKNKSFKYVTSLLRPPPCQIYILWKRETNLRTKKNLQRSGTERQGDAIR